MLTITRTVHFCAAHRLFNPSWPDERNRKVYGRCSNPGGHGHNYTLAVSVTGRLDDETGMVVNVTELGEVLRREVVERLDHRNLNTDVPFLKNVVPTMENIVAKLAARLESPLGGLGVRLVKLELSESDKNRVTLEFT